MRFLATVILAFVIKTAAFAGDPVTYQGRLELGGAPYTGTVDVRFQVFEGNWDGAASVGVASEVLGVSVTDGLFTTEFDYSEDGIMSEDRWLQVSVREAGGVYEELLPRQKITLVPRAQQARGAELREDGTVVFKPGRSSADGLVYFFDESSTTVRRAASTWQSFEADDFGIPSVVFVSGEVALGDLIQVFVYEGEGVGGALVATGSGATADVELGGGIQVSIETGAAVKPGEKYTVSVLATDTAAGLPGAIDFTLATGDAYAGGRSNFGGALDLSEFGVSAVRYTGSVAEVDDEAEGNFGSMRVTGYSESISNSNSNLVLPEDSVSAFECLQEPGVVAEATSDAAATISSTTPTFISSAVMNQPQAGAGVESFAFAMASFTAEISHTIGTESGFTFAFSEFGDTPPAGEGVTVSIPSSAATGTYKVPVTVHGVFGLLAAQKNVQLRGYRVSATSGPTARIRELRQTLIYLPTAYGNVELSNE